MESVLASGKLVLQKMCQRTLMSLMWPFQWSLLIDNENNKTFRKNGKMLFLSNSKKDLCHKSCHNNSTFENFDRLWQDWSIRDDRTGRQKKRLMVISVTPQRPTNKKTNKQSIKFFITLTDASVKTNQPKIVINKMLNVTVDSKNCLNFALLWFSFQWNRT